jgi:hypothetical protein
MRFVSKLSTSLLLAGLLAGCAGETRPTVGPHSAYGNNDTYDGQDCTAADRCVDYGAYGYPAHAYPPTYREYGYRDCAYGEGCTVWHEN